MNFTGICDSAATLLTPPAACPRCGAAARINGGECLSCLLQAGIEEGSDEADLADFDAVLADIEVSDVDWRLGNYQVLEEIGRGGMGVIYRARQRHSKRIVALKRVLGYHGDSPETLERFRREAEAAASLDHPNILPIYEVGEADGLPFFTMKFATGGSLQQAAPALRSEPRECVRLLAKITRAVAYAHREGILHRDLKPGNILLDSRGEPMVSDFGLAKWIDAHSDLTRSLAIFGTPGFIAPEQTQGKRDSITPAADIYSLGAILFDLLAGRPPFLGEHALAVLRQAAEKPAPKLRTFLSTADRDLETICAKCLDREPAARYRSASDLAEDLERWLEGRPIIARPVSLSTQAWRWSKRNPVLASAAGACALLSFLALATWASRSRLDAEVQRTAAALRSLAVLPFEDLDELVATPRSQQLTSDLIARLPFVRNAPTSARVRPAEWRQLGHSLVVSNLLSGTVRSRAGKARATLQLVDASSGLPVRRWLYEADGPAELSAMAAQAVNTIVTARANRKDPGPTSGEIEGTEKADAAANPLARDYFVAAQELKARYNVADLYRSIELTEKSVAADPTYARAQALLASSCLSRSEFDPNGPWLEKGLAAAQRATALDPMLPEAHRANAAAFRSRGRMRDSVESFLSAYELDPLDHRNAGMLGNMVQQIGRPDLALRWLHKAVRLEPRPGIWTEYMADAWSDLADEEEATRLYMNANTFRPDLPGGDVGLARLALFRKDFKDARAQCDEARQKFASFREPLAMAAQVAFFAGDFSEAEAKYRDLLVTDRNGGIDFTGSCRFLSAVGFMRLQEGGADEGQSLLREARELDLHDLQTAPDNLRRLYSLAAIDAALGDKREALDALRRAVDAGWIDYQSMALDPRFGSIRETSESRATIDQLTEKVTRMRTAALADEETAPPGGDTHAE